MRGAAVPERDWKRSPPARARTRTGARASRAASSPAPDACPNASRPWASSSSASPSQGTSNQGGGGACSRTRPRWTPSSTPACTEPYDGVAARRAQLLHHRGEPRRRRRRQSVLAQEPAQDVAGAMSGQGAQRRADECIVLDDRLRIEAGEVLGEQRGLGLVSRRAGERGGRRCRRWRQARARPCGEPRFAGAGAARCFRRRPSAVPRRPHRRRSSNVRRREAGATRGCRADRGAWPACRPCPAGPHRATIAESASLPGRRGGAPARRLRCPRPSRPRASAA